MDTEDAAFLKELQERCGENGNKLAVVTYNRSAYSFDGDWLDGTDALMAAFYPGQAGGTAIANLLTGKTNPSGKLSVTMPKSYKDMLLYWEEWDTNGNGEYDEGEDYENYLAWQRYGQGAAVFYQGTRTEYYAQYNEGLYFGYRWYDFKDIQPQYAYGYGLSYTAFEYSDIAVDDRGDEIDVTVTVTNTGGAAGAEIVQVYLGSIEVPDNVQMSEKQLAAFGRTGELQPGQSETITMTVSERMLSYWDDSIEDDNLIEYDDGTRGKWVLAEGERALYVGSSSDDLSWSTTVYPEHIVEANKTTLNKIIAYAQEQMKKDDYQYVVEEVREGFEAALENAKAVSANLRSTQKETEEAWTTLVKWVHGLGIMTGDKTLLLEAITAAGGYNLDNYAEDGKQDFRDALGTAQSVYEDKFAKQDAVDDATGALVDAILALRLKANTANLDALLSQARTMDLSLYTAESANLLRTAMAAADAVLRSDPSIDEQDAVDNAETNLRSSIDGLVKLGDSGKGDPGRDDTSKEDPEISDSGKDTSDPDQDANGSSNTKPGSDAAGSASGTTSSASASNGKKKNVYTGNAAPIAWAAGAILLGGIGVMFTRKKKFEE